MASVRTFLCLGLSLSAGIIKAADPKSKAENVRWTSLDFKTMLSWTTKTPENTYSIRYSIDEGDWIQTDHCYKLSDHRCDLTEELKYSDRAFIADVLTDITDDDYDHGDYQHTESSPFNPYKETNISAVEFRVHAVNESTMLINITDTLTSVHDRKQLTIRDIFKQDLLYKINYHKAESTGKREKLSENSAALVYNLDPGTRYCFMVAAVIKTRPPKTQQGAWSQHLCGETYGDPGAAHELGPGAWVGLIFILLTVFIIFVTVTVLCCRNRRQKNNPPQSQSQSSAPV